MNRRTFLKHSSEAVATLTVSAVAQASRATEKPSPGPARGPAEDPIAALRPPKRERPVVAIIIDAEGSETTDTLIPFGVLAESGLVDVSILADTAQPVRLFPALTIRPQTTLQAFDANYPDGSDYVFVPASHRLEGSPLIPWIAEQARRDATLIGVCAGAKSLAVAGLLKGRRATTHWYELDHLLRLEPDLIHVPDQRYVADGRIITTTGVTASLPVSLALVEAIGGLTSANRLAETLGITDWGTGHDSDAFRIKTSTFFTGLINRLSVRRRIGIPIENGVSEIALAFAADAWSRTFRSQAFAVSRHDSVTTRHGLDVLPDRHRAEGLKMEQPPVEDRPAGALDAVLERIADRFGSATADFVALQLEYTPRPR